MSQYNFHDVMLGILSNFPEGKDQYRYDWEDLHNFFYKNRTKYGVLNKLAFDTDGLTPFSREIDSGYETLQVSRLVCSMSPDFNPHCIENGVCRVAFDRFSQSRFNKKEKDELKRLSADFIKEFSLEAALQ